MGCIESRVKKVDDGSVGWNNGSATVYINNSVRPVCVLRMPNVVKENQSGCPQIKGTGIRNTEFVDDEEENRTVQPKAASSFNKFDAIVTGKYRFLRIIGTGRFSCVWLVENRLTKIPYAIKMTAGSEGREIFHSELEILSRVKHPNVVQLIETFERENRFYMVSELATGGDLFDRTQSQPGGRFSEPDAGRIIFMISDGLRYLHRLGITHRDLKLDNLLFYHPGPDSKILITDFAVAYLRKTGNSKYMSTACGTPEYIAPEILLHQPYTSAVDLWSLGVVVYCILSGSFPFTNDENNQENNKLYIRIIRSDYSFDSKVWESISEIGISFIKDLLNSNPSERLTAADVMRHPWILKYTSNPNSSLSGSEDGSGNTLSSSRKRSRRGRKKCDRDPELSKLKRCIIDHQNRF